MSRLAEGARARAPLSGSAFEVLLVFLRLGLSSFGGPVAHLGYYRDELVVRRRWVDEATYADLVALCQFLPGPASSQTAIGMGILRAGVWGGLAAWVGFTLPSALALVAFAYGLEALGMGGEAGWLHGLKVAAVAVVAQAVWAMATKLCPDRPRATIAVAAAVVALLWPTGAGQVVIIVAAGLAGARWLRVAESAPAAHLLVPVSRALGAACLALLAALLVALPLARAAASSNQALAVFESFFRSGALVFGGGHVVLPLLYAEVVPPGWVSASQFTAGYGAAQAVPGPIFTFAAYLGAAMRDQPVGAWGAPLALLGIFAPGALLVVGALPFWGALRARPDVQAALRGINAAVVGLLLAALYTPVFTSAIFSAADAALALAAFALLELWRLPAWLVVLGAALCGSLLAAITA